MFDFLSELFDTSDFPARWNCGRWTEAHGWLHILSDLGVWSAYVAIPCVLLYFVLRRRDIPFRGIFVLFGAFILACGTTHLMEAIIFWWPAYRLAGAIKLFTALVSWGTVLALIPATPKALAMRTPEELEKEMAARKGAEDALARANAELRRQVEALRASEERFRLLVEGARDHAIFMLDPAGRVASWNPGGERIKQYRAEEIVGRHISHFYPEEEVRAGKPDRELRVAAAEGRYEEEGWRLRKDGSRFWANVVITALRDDAGELRGFSKITRDMTERKQADENARRLLDEAAARRAAEELAAAVREERERLRVTLNSIGDGVIATDAEGRVTLLNPVAEALTGWAGADAAGRPLRDVFHIVNEMTRQPVDNPVAKVLVEGKTVGLANHTVLIAADGTERPIADSAAPIRHQDGTIAGVVLVFRDATEQRRAEESERKTREIFRLVHQIGKIGHWEWDSLTDENRWSPEIEALYGLAPGGFEGGYAGWAKRVHPDDLPRAEADVRRALQTGKYFSEFRVIWPDGSVHWLETRAHVFKDGNDRPVRIMGVNMDITERKRQEEALRENRQRLADELEAMTRLHSLSTRLVSSRDLTALKDVLENAVVTCAADFGNIQLYNPQTRGLEIVAQRGFRQDFFDYFRLVRVDEGSACAQAMQSGERIVIEDVNLDAGYEPHRTVAAAAGYRAVQSTPLKGRDGSILGMLSTHFRVPHRPGERDERLLDLYARHAADLIERIRYEEALKDADRRKNEFLATLAHELRNPLAPLRNALELLHRAEGDPAVREQARGMMGRQLDQMVRLIDELLDVTRISQGKVRLRTERVGLKEVVKSALESVQPLVQAQEHELTVELPAGDVYLDADPTRLAQVISNLVNNAAKYTDRGGRIRLAAERRGGEVMISVRDTGIGIAAEHLPHLFEMFSQVSPALERSQGGLGIGLSLVRALVELHRGRVEARSEGVGRGSEFIVRLPAADGPAPREPARAPEVGNIAGKWRILAVDDNRDAADSLALMLRTMGHETRTAYDGPEALRAAAEFRPEVVLLDIGLPKMNGYEVARELRRREGGEGLALIALTGWGQEEDRKRALEAGFDHHLTKPVDVPALERLLAVTHPAPRLS
jgi:PAS domain S-box-containing protein